MSAVAETPMYPEWFRDSLSRIDEDALPVRLNEDCRHTIKLIAAKLGWSEARVVRILVNHSLQQLGP